MSEQQRRRPQQQQFVPQQPQYQLYEQQQSPQEQQQQQQQQYLQQQYQEQQYQQQQYQEQQQQYQQQMYQEQQYWQQQYPQQEQQYWQQQYPQQEQQYWQQQQYPQQEQQYQQQFQNPTQPSKTLSPSSNSEQRATTVSNNLKPFLAFIKARSALLCIAFILGLAYTLFIWLYINNAGNTTDTAYNIGNAFASILLTPHAFLTSFATLFTILGWALRYKWSALTAGILYIVAGCTAPSLLLLVLVQATLCFISFAHVKKNTENHPLENDDRSSK